MRYVDHAVGELRRGFREAGADRNLLTIFTGDHGESLGEHGEATHGFFVYDATTLVPLVFHWLGRIVPGASAAPARLVDVVPTILELVPEGDYVELDTSPRKERGWKGQAGEPLA